MLFEKVGGSYQIVINRAEDMLNLLDLPAAYWSVTGISLDALAMDAQFLAFLDDDSNGRIRVDEVKRAVAFLKKTLIGYENLEKGSDVLRFCDLNKEDPDGEAILSSATLAMKNTGHSDPQEISLQDICDRSKIIAAGLANGDGIIPPALLEDPLMKSAGELIVRQYGKCSDASGMDGFNSAALAKFSAELQAYINWVDARSASADILPFGENTPACFGAVQDVEKLLDEYFELCAQAGLFGIDPRSGAYAGNLMNREDAASLLQKAPLCIPDPEGVFTPGAKLNPLYRKKIEKLFALVLEGKETLNMQEWEALKGRFAPYKAYQAAKPTALLDSADLETLRVILKEDVPARLQALIDADLSHAGEIATFDKVRKLILFQKYIMKFLRNYVNLRVLFDPEGESILLAGTLVMDGQNFRLATKVASIPEHKKIAVRSNICVMYVNAQTGPKTAVRQMNLAIAVTSGEMTNLFVGKCGVFFTPDDVAWDAKIVDFIQQPVSVSEALKMPFIRFGEFISKQVDKFFSARSKEFEQGFDKSVKDAQNYKPGTAAAPAAAKQTPAVSGSMMLMGGGVGLAAIGSAFAFIAQTLKNVSYWNVIGVFLIIMLIFGGPMVLLSLVKLFRRNMATFLEAGGLALNKRMRLSHTMGKIFSGKSYVPYRNRSRNADVIHGFLRAEIRKNGVEETPVKNFFFGVLVFLLAAVLGTGIGCLIWKYFLA